MRLDGIEIAASRHLPPLTYVARGPDTSAGYSLMVGRLDEHPLPDWATLLILSESDYDAVSGLVAEPIEAAA